MREVRGNDIAMIFQEPMTSLNPLLTIGYQISEVLVRHRHMSPREARAEAISFWNGPHSRRREPLRRVSAPLSGGMRQRVMIAMALACKPKLLIADEPTTALDVTIQAQILSLIKTLQQEEGTSVLFITHDMGVVAEIADRTIVMYQGEAVEAGTTDAVFNRPQHAYTRLLLSAVPQLGSMRTASMPRPFPIDRSGDRRLQAEPRPASYGRRGRRPLLEVARPDDALSPCARGLLGLERTRPRGGESVSFDLWSGETLSLVGESGCGKSTTGRSILRLVEPTSGSVHVDGEDVLRPASGRCAICANACR